MNSVSCHRRTSLKLMHLLLLGGVLILLHPQATLAHGRELPTPENVWIAWNWDPLILTGLALTIWLYVRGVTALWRRAGAGCGIRRWQVAAFTGGMLVAFIALISPIDPLGEALFSAHMIQHLLLIVVAAPLLVLGKPLLAWVWAVPPTWRRAIGGWWRQRSTLRSGWRAITLPPITWLIHSVAVWTWHIPLLYEGALHSPWLHALEHACFFGSALLFWWVIIHPGTHGRLAYGASVLYLFGLTTQGVVIGALIAFANTIWYPSHAIGAALWGLTPLDDQRLAGLLMWVPPSVVYMIAVGFLFTSWFRALEHNMRRREQRWLQHAAGTTETHG